MAFIPDEAIERSQELKPSAFSLYVYYCMRRNKETGTCFPKLRRAATDLHIEYTYASKLRAELVTKGWIAIEDGEVKPLVGFGRELARTLTNKPDRAAPSRRTTAGYVYVIKSENGRYKIGLTRNLDARLSSIATASPFLTQLAHYFKTSQMRELEKALHDHFAAKRQQGEWFELDREDMDWLRDLNAEQFLNERA